MYKYPVICFQFQQRIKKKYPDSLPTIDELDRPGFALWLIEKMGSDDIFDSVEASHLIGIIFGILYSLNLVELKEFPGLTPRFIFQ